MTCALGVNVGSVVVLDWAGLRAAHASRSCWWSAGSIVVGWCRRRAARGRPAPISPTISFYFLLHY